MIEKLQALAEKYDDLTNKISDPDVIADQANWQKYAKELGEMVMDGLKQIDEVAYVRFASVYRQFKDISTFMKELKKLQKDNIVKEHKNEKQPEENG